MQIPIRSSLRRNASSKSISMMLLTTIFLDCVRMLLPTWSSFLTSTDIVALLLRRRGSRYDHTDVRGFETIQILTIEKRRLLPLSQHKRDDAGAGRLKHEIKDFQIQLILLVRSGIVAKQ